MSDLIFDRDKIRLDPPGIDVHDILECVLGQCKRDNVRLCPSCLECFNVTVIHRAWVHFCDRCRVWASEPVRQPPADYIPSAQQEAGALAHLATFTQVDAVCVHFLPLDESDLGDEVKA